MNPSVVKTAPPAPDCGAVCGTAVAVHAAFSPLTFATALAGCIIVVFTISFVVYILRRGDCLFLADEENPPSSESRRVIARLNPDFTKPGLDPTVIQSIPVIIFRPQLEKTRPAGAGAVAPRGEVGGLASPLVSDDRDINQRIQSMLECAVCLGDYIEGERIKVVPACGHGFHAECIDLWLSAKPTCPICRCNLAPKDPPRKEDPRVDSAEGETETGGSGVTRPGGAEAGGAAETAGAGSRGAGTGLTRSQGSAIPSAREATLPDDVVIVPIAAGA